MPLQRTNGTKTKTRDYCCRKTEPKKTAWKKKKKQRCETRNEGMMLWCLDWEIIMCAPCASPPTHVAYKCSLVFVSRLRCISETLTAATATITINKMIDFNRAVSQRAHRHGACKSQQIDVKSWRFHFASSEMVVSMEKYIKSLVRSRAIDAYTNHGWAERAFWYSIHSIITFARLTISWNVHIPFSPNLSPPPPSRIAHTCLNRE